MSLEDKISKQVRSIPRSGIRDFFELVEQRDPAVEMDDLKTPLPQETRPPMDTAVGVI